MPYFCAEGSTRSTLADPVNATRPAVSAAGASVFTMNASGYPAALMPVPAMTFPSAETATASVNACQPGNDKLNLLCKYDWSVCVPSSGVQTVATPSACAVPTTTLPSAETEAGVKLPIGSMPDSGVQRNAFIPLCPTTTEPSAETA